MAEEFSASTQPVSRAVAGLLLLGLWTVSSPLLADSLALYPVADATLIETTPNNSSGGAGFFNAGTTQNLTRNRALIRFDIASSVPANSVITSAGLMLEVTRQPADGFEPSVFGLHRVLRGWGEGGTVPLDNPGGLGAPAAVNDATWTDRFAFTPETWAEPGGAPGIDYDPNSSSAAFIYGVNESPYLFESTRETVADTQSWLDNPALNFGWMLMTSSEDAPFTARRFASREDPVGRGPILFVEFQPVPEPGTISLAVLGSLLLFGFHRRKRA